MKVSIFGSYAGCYHGNASGLRQGLKHAYSSFMQNSLISFFAAFAYLK